MRPNVLALDLEGTLISNAMSQIPRPGLFAFLERCSELFPRLMVFTAISETRFRPIARMLAGEGSAPAWFGEVERVDWAGPTKDLAYTGLPVIEVLLVDDLPAYVHPGQEDRWIPISPFSSPYPDDDAGLAVALVQIERRLRYL